MHAVDFAGCQTAVVCIDAAHGSVLIRIELKVSIVNLTLRVCVQRRTRSSSGAGAPLVQPSIADVLSLEGRVNLMKTDMAYAAVNKAGSDPALRRPHMAVIVAAADASTDAADGASTSGGGARAKRGALPRYGDVKDALRGAMQGGADGVRLEGMHGGAGWVAMAAVGAWGSTHGERIVRFFAAPFVFSSTCTERLYCT